MPRTMPVLTFPELYRLAHAFLGGHPFRPGQTVHVVLSRAAPLYRIQGIFATRKEAERALATTPPGWEQAELDARIRYPVKIPSTRTAEVKGMQTMQYSTSEASLRIVGHSQWTEATAYSLQSASLARSDESAAKGGSVGVPSTLGEIEGVELRLLSARGAFHILLPALTDAVFLTRGAVDGMLIPWYYTIFGRAHAEARRESLLSMAGQGSVSGTRRKRGDATKSRKRG